MTAVTFWRVLTPKRYSSVTDVLHAYLVAVEQGERAWQWWRDESWWRGIAEKAAAGLVVALLVKPTVWPWVLGAAMAGLVALGSRWLGKRIRALRKARAARRDRRPRHARAPLPMPPGRSGASAPPRRRPSRPSWRPALYLAVAAIGAILVNLFVPAEDPTTPLHEQPSYTNYDGKWYDPTP